MTRLPTLSSKKIIKALDKAGFVTTRQTGSHYVMRNPITRKTTVVPIHGKDVKRGLMKEILQQAGVSEDIFRKLL